MSKIVVGWQLDDDLDDGRIQRVISQVKTRYQPLFQDTLEHTGLWRRNQGLLHFDVPQPGGPWHSEERDRLICVTGAPSLTSDASLGGAPLDAKVLHNHLFESAGHVNRRVLHRINPPFTVCSFDKVRRTLTVVHDGLGADQFFISSIGQGIAFSNKCWPLLLFGRDDPRIDVEAWRYWFSVGWFPQHTTPFENVRYLGRGEIVRADSRTVAFDAEDTLRSWIVPPGEGESAATLMPRALDSVRRIVRSHSETSAPYSADLTGGRDSRAICSVLIKEGIPCAFYTGGPGHSADVILAKQVARRFNLDWHHVDEPPIAGEHLATLIDAQFKKLLLWGEGLVEPNRFAHFGREPCPTELGAYLSGGSSEISKGYWYAHLVQRHPEKRVDVRTALTSLEQRIDGCLQEGDASGVKQRLWEQVMLGESYGIAGLLLLNVFYLTERVRRWQAAHLAVNLFDRTILPFVNIEHIQLAFAMAPADQAEQTFQTFIIDQNVRELLQIPFTDHFSASLGSRLLHAMLRPRQLVGLIRSVLGNHYLRREGRALVDAVFSTETPLWEILDKQKAKARWEAFIRGSDRDVTFVLGLLSFQYWHAMFIETPVASSFRTATRICPP